MPRSAQGCNGRLDTESANDTLDVTRTDARLPLVIQSFSCRDTDAVFEGKPCRRFTNIRGVLERKLTMLHAAHRLLNLQASPNNRLEKLAGDRAGQHSIRVNDQYRLTFRWTQAGPAEVACVDYH